MLDHQIVLLALHVYRVVLLVLIRPAIGENDDSALFHECVAGFHVPDRLHLSDQRRSVVVLARDPNEPVNVAMMKPHALRTL